MAFDLDEQEQLDNLKAFWERWGSLISTLVVAGVIAFAGWKGYEFYQVKQSEKAALAYDSYVQAAQKKDATVDAALATIQNDYGKTRYAALATIQAAQMAVEAQQWDKAQAPLQWLLSNGSTENQAVARLMLADVLAQIGKTDEALKTLDTVPHADFSIAFANKKSDIYLQLKDTANARTSLEQAIKLAKEQGVRSKEIAEALQGKLNLLPKA